MTEQKYTVDEVTKALKCISGEEEVFCRECVYSKEGGGFSCKKNAARDSLSIIASQKADIRRLAKAIEVQEIMLKNHDRKIKETKEEAVKEFAERLKKECLFDRGYEILQEGTIDHLVKEFTEEKK